MSDNEKPHVSRRRFLQAGVATAAGLSVLGGNPKTAAAAAADPDTAGPAVGKPNILFLMVDEQRYPTPYESPELKAFRHNYLLTQRKLRETGIEFKRHYAASVACAPSRASLYTGHYPSLHGVTNTDGAAKDMSDPGMFWLDPNTVPTLGNYFRTAGYRTFWKGKWHVAEVNLPIPGTHDALPSYDENGNPDPENQALYLHANRLQEFGFSGWIGPEPHGSNPLNSASSAGGGKRSRDVGFADQTIALIRQLDAQSNPNPWFIMASLLNPHDIALWGMWANLQAELQQQWDFSIGPQVPQHPFDTTLFRQTHLEDLSTKPGCQKSYRNSYRKFMQPILLGRPYHRFYYQLHQNVDEQLGRIYDALVQSRFFNNTIVVFTSDHGDLLDAHGGLHQKWYTAYEEALHVPLIFSSPALFGGARSSSLLTSHVDVLPTLLGLADLDAEALRQQLAGDHSEAQPLVGKNLAPLIRGGSDASALQEAIYFMTDDDPSRGLNQENILGIPYASVKQPNHIETVIARFGGKLWKYSRYFDNPQFWSAPGTPGDSGVQDEILQEIGNEDTPGTTIVECKKTVKITPRADEFEMYNLSDDPLELSNLAGQPAYATQEQKLKILLHRQCNKKRLTPSSGDVPGQPSC
ncbi:MAG: sulfatase-like hydrolase/transferase [Gammaproteobacteria bacterium]